MSNYTLVFDCPCCQAKHVTCDVKASHTINTQAPYYKWEFFCVCRKCNLGFCLNSNMKSPNDSITSPNWDGGKLACRFNKLDYLVPSGREISYRFTDFKNKEILSKAELPPEHTPEELEIIFKEAAQCLAIGCFNASGAMFRLCLDMVTKDIIESNNEHKPTAQDKKTIHTRLVWIFNNKILPNSLEALSRCIKDDGNDAAHDGTIGKAEAEDLLDFTRILLERVYTEPERIRLAEVRRAERRQN